MHALPDTTAQLPIPLTTPSLLASCLFSSFFGDAVPRYKMNSSLFCTFFIQTLITRCIEVGSALFQKRPS